MSDIKLGAQLYTLRDYIQNYEDAEKTFAYLDSIGINTIQISAIGPIEPEKIAYLVDKYSMDVCVTHIDTDDDAPFGCIPVDLQWSTDKVDAC